MMDDGKVPDQKPHAWLWALRLIPLYAIYRSLYQKHDTLPEALFIGLCVWAVVEGILWVVRRMVGRSGTPPQ
jgi:hypothetical protein